MAHKTSLIGEVKNGNDISSDVLFDEAIRLCLQDYKENQVKILRLLCESFITEKNLSLIGINTFKSRDKLLHGYSSANNIFLKEKILKKHKKFQEDIGTIFHELTHIETGNKNKKKSFAYNDNFDYYVEINSKIFGDNLAYALYFLSTDELKSRLAEINYSKKFIDRMEYILSNEPNFATKYNFNLLEIYKKNTNKLERKTNKKIEKYNKIKQKYTEKIKIKTEKCLDFIKLYDVAKIDHWKIRKLYISLRLIIDYLYSYKDKIFFNKVFEYLKSNKASQLSFCAVDILKSGCVKYKKEDIDRLIFFLKDETYIKQMNLKNIDLVKHNLLFYGNADFHQIERINGETLSDEFKKRTNKKFNKFKFIGIPFDYKFDYDLNSNEKIKDTKYFIKLNGKTFKFNTQNEMFLEITKYINSSMLDDLSEENIKKINSVFEKDIIIDLSKEAQTKQENNFLAKRKDKIKSKNNKNNNNYLFSDVFEIEPSFTF